MHALRPHRLSGFLGSAPLIVLVILSACLTPAAAHFYSAAGKQVHLPLVFRQFALQNGGFENGRTGWVESSHIIYDKTGLQNNAPHTGSWAAWLGGYWNELDTLTQTVSINHGATVLVYWRWILSEETNCGVNVDYTRVLVNGSILQQDPLCTTTNTGGWVKQSIDLSSYAGSAISLQFMAYADDQHNNHSNSSLYLDDISLQAPP